MAFSPLDDPVLAGVFINDELEVAHSSSAWINRLLSVEAALAQAQAELGVIPVAAAEAIASLSADNMDVERLGTRAAIVGFPIVGLVEQIASLLPDGLGQYAHWGATTQDILDTALVLQLRDVLELIDRDLTATAATMAGLANQHRHSLMIGRSQLQPGLPITFGLRAAGWLSGLTRHLERLDQLGPRLLVTQLSGAVGTAASLGETALAVQARFADLLGLEVSEVNWHTQRDRFAEVAMVAAMISGSLGKVGLDVALSAQFEVGELREGSGSPGAGTSSTMPQKRNPIGAQRLIHAARLTRPLAMTMLEAEVTDHDRGTGVWPTEWAALPSLMALTAAAAATAAHLTANLEVNVERMEANLRAVGEPIMAEAAMMALAPKIGRQLSHDLVAAALRAGPDRGLVAAISDAGHQIDPSVIEPANYLGTTSQQIDRSIATFEAVRPQAQV